MNTKSFPSFFSRVLRDSTPRFVGQSICQSVRPLVRLLVRPSVRHTLLFFWFFRSLSSLPLPK